MKKYSILFVLPVVASLVLSACKKEIVIEGESALPDWTTATHSNDVPPNYSVVFGENKVHRIDIVLTAEEWSAMQADLQDVQGSGGGGPGQTFSDQTPQYFPCDFYYNGKQWYEVGVRYKGNSSLRANSNKLPLRLDFNKFQDEFPDIRGQRFYGFEELSLSSNYNDASLIREKAAADIFRDFGVPAARTAFYQVYIDYGDGPIYHGVYTMVEVIFDTMLEDYFGSNSGNCYKPEDDGAQFAQNIFNLEDFELKTNEIINDKSDIQELFDILHSGDRTSNPDVWKTNLESVFDVDGFLKYLAANNTMQNWDTYGRMSHNYYLYHDPQDGLIKWITWDNNEAFQNGKRGGSLSFAMSEVGTDWPLIPYIIGDSEYEAKYKSYLQQFVTTSFESSRIQALYSQFETLLYSSAEMEQSGYSYLNGISGFTSAMSTMKSHNTSRISAVNAYLQ